LGFAAETYSALQCKPLEPKEHEDLIRLARLFPQTRNFSPVCASH